MTPWTSDDFIELWRTLFPASYIEAIEDSVGFDWVAASAAVFARVDQAISASQQRLFIKPHSQQRSDPASGGAKATGLVTIRRANTVGTFLVPAGTLVRPLGLDSFGDERLGPAFALVGDVTFADGVAEQDTTVQAVTIGEHANLKGSAAELQLQGRFDYSAATVGALGLNVDASASPDRVSSGLVGRLVQVLDGANAGEFRQVVSVASSGFGLSAAVDIATTAFEAVEFEDVGVAAAAIGDTTGGLDAWLDALGEEQLVRRQLGESEDAYRARICSLSDTISPAAIKRMASRTLTPSGTPWAYKEADDGLGFVLGVSAYDTTGPDGLWRLIARSKMVRYFIICVGQTSAGDIGFPYDALATPADWFPNALGQGFLDGRAIEWEASVAALYAALQTVKAGGVSFDILLDPAL